MKKGGKNLFPLVWQVQNRLSFFMRGNAIDTSCQFTDASVVYDDGLARVATYSLHAFGETVCAKPGPLKWVSVTSRFQWKWFDGRSCYVQFRSWYSKTTLFVSGTVAYQLSGMPLSVGVNVFTSFKFESFKLEWRTIQEKRVVMTVDVLCSSFKEALAPCCRFSDANGRTIAIFDFAEFSRLDFGRVSPAPIAGFSGSGEELLLIWAFIVASHNFD